MRRLVILVPLGLSLVVPAARAEVSSPEPVWLAGDLHVHSCYSHDAWCGPGDDNTGPDEAYTLGGTVDQRFAEASLRGLDFLAVTDHNDVRSHADPAFGSHGVIGLPAYEWSIAGHAQVFGVDEVYDEGDSSAASINGVVERLHAVGGLIQANHPADGLDGELDAACTDTSTLHWSYGFDVVPDTIEVWNIGHLVQPPFPVGTSNTDAIRYWECWLDRGFRIGATGGSDSHWLATTAAQGPGHPTTWVLADDRSAAGLLAGMRGGRTSVTFAAPALGGPMLVLEADADDDGTFEAVIGDDVPPGTSMRVRADGLTDVGFVDVRANGQTIVDDAVLVPGGEVVFDSPGDIGWVRAELSVPDASTERRELCDDLLGDQTTYCRNPVLLRALTSPIYLR